MTENSVPQKQCNTCNEVFSETKEYFRFNKTRNQFYARCLICDRTAQNKREKEKRLNNPELMREKGKRDQRRFRAKYKDKLKVKARIRRKKQFDANPDLARAKAREKYKRKMANPDSKKKLQAKGIRNNAKRKQLKFNNANCIDFTSKDVETQLKSQKGKCWWCGKKLKKYHVDHRIPLARGGDNSAGNIVISCPHCNCSRNDKMPWEWNGRLL